jgi:hypothetical protein
MTLYARYVCTSTYVLFDIFLSLTMMSIELYQPTSAWALKQVWPEITLHIVPDAGHSSREPGITKLLVEVRLSREHIFAPKAHLVRLTGHGQICRPVSDEERGHDGNTSSASYPVVPSVPPRRTVTGA